MKNAKQTAINFLSFRDHSELELSQKLTAKGFDQDQINPVIEKLKNENLLNDQKFACNYQYFRRQKGYGPIRIKQELQNKGIASDIIAEALDITDNDWLKQAKLIWLKHFGGRIAKDLKEKAKQIRFLQYRGFTQDQITIVLGERDAPL